MTTLHAPTAFFTAPFSVTIRKLFSSVSHYQASKTRRARLARQIALLSSLDSHMLNDIGLKGFNRLPPDQQENLLVDTIKRA